MIDFTRFSSMRQREIFVTKLWYEQTSEMLSYGKLQILKFDRDFVWFVTGLDDCIFQAITDGETVSFEIIYQMKSGTMEHKEELKKDLIKIIEEKEHYLLKHEKIRILFAIGSTVIFFYEPDIIYRIDNFNTTQDVKIKYLKRPNAK